MSEIGSEQGSPREQGATLMRMGRYPEAAAALRRAAEQTPLDEGVWRLLGGALSQAGDTAGAVAAFEKTVALAPDSARNHYNLALALQSVARLYEAKTHFEQALSLDPGYAQARTALDELTVQTAARGYGKTAEEPAAPPTSPAPTLRAPGAPIGGMPPGSAPAGGAAAGGMARMDDDLVSVGGMGGAAPPPAAAPPPSGAAPPYLAPGPVAGYAPPPHLGMAYGQTENTSGTKGQVPLEVQGGWNWGAFYFSWIWLFAHQVYGWAWAMLGAVILSNMLQLGGFLSAMATLGSRPPGAPMPPNPGAGFMGGNLLAGLIGWIYFGCSIYLGIAGNRLGWQHRRFASVEDYRACERTWAYWVLGIFLFGIVLTIVLVAAVLLPAISAARNAAQGR